MRIVNIVGARPNFMKIAPLLDEMRSRPGIEPLLVHTGQHYDARMSDQFLEQLGIPEPDLHLGVGSGSHAEQTSQVMIALESALEELRPDLVLVVGDVNSTVAAALVAAKAGIPLAHVEAGLRSFDRRMPEEVNRIVTDVLADYLFVTERSGIENLRNEGIPAERIFLVGNVMIDTLLRNRARAEALDMPGRSGVTAGAYALATMHRPSNVDDPELLAGFLGVFEEVSAKLPILFPLHPRTSNALEKFGLMDRLRGLEGVEILEPQGYLEFLGLTSQARLVLTDSGGIQEETTALGVPCLTLRENTERPITVSEGTNRLVGTRPAEILAAVGEVLAGGAGEARRPELWDGRASERIVEILVERIGEGS
jgi:UDP-N-acetylglucosamine 2-epimerase (non-hydrolysing)